MSIAIQLRNYNNYATLMAIMAAMSNASILRLKRTNKAVENKKIYREYKALEQLMSSEKSYHSYRVALKTSNTAKIPYL